MKRDDAPTSLNVVDGVSRDLDDRVLDNLGVLTLDDRVQAGRDHGLNESDAVGKDETARREEGRSVRAVEDGRGAAGDADACKGGKERVGKSVAPRRGEKKRPLGKTATRRGHRGSSSARAHVVRPRRHCLRGVQSDLVSLVAPLEAVLAPNVAPFAPD